MIKPEEAFSMEGDFEKKEDRARRCADLAIQWLMGSGIQNDNSNLHLEGGINAWYDCIEKQYSFVYPEATGYGITTLVYLYKILNDSIFLEKAKLAANWLIEHAWDDSTGHFPYKYDLGSNSFIPLAYAFDEGMILNGLVNLYRETGDRRYEETVNRGAYRLIETWQRDDGAFTPLRSLTAGDTLDKLRKWSRQPGSFLAKNVIGLLNWHSVINDPILLERAIKACEWALRFQDEEGFFVTSTYDHSTHLHAHCYSAEGLWVAGKLLGEEKYLDAAAKATKWALDNQLPNGGIPRIYRNGQFISAERTDIIAQTVRLGVLMISEGALAETYLKNIERALEQLLTFQRLEGPPEEKGGFVFGFQSEGLLAEHVNSCCTLFALQASILYSQYHQGELNFDPLLLV
ncbi:MAG: hypothetical protein RX318_00435 [bacterium]|nr:hypothetical protein [bacterium]